MATEDALLARRDDALAESWVYNAVNIATAKWTKDARIH